MAQTANTTVIRTGVVLEKGGGALGKILPIFQLFAGGPLVGRGMWFITHGSTDAAQSTHSVDPLATRPVTTETTSQPS
jgi:NAD dependent epimerase/dehydratase family enzyme